MIPVLDGPPSASTSENFKFYLWAEELAASSRERKRLLTVCNITIENVVTLYVMCLNRTFHQNTNVVGVRKVRNSMEFIKFNVKDVFEVFRTENCVSTFAITSAGGAEGYGWITSLGLCGKPLCVFCPPVVRLSRVFAARRE